ncbi:ScbR family autoregulator-binding transcription factor [Streptomyces sp. NPDC006645]|uniref:ScbR family autoregulator-binding transcription factor n=1 Tax=unclassified Streptomyces TaxID=2593676 RepID=UPI0033B9CDAA
MAKQYRAVRTRQELIRSAAEVFDDVGFADSSISAISSRAGVSTGALHFHFGNKQALGSAVELAAAQTLLRITGHVPLRDPAPLQHLVDTSHTLAGYLLGDRVLRAGFRLGSDPAWRGGGDLWEQWQDWVQLMLVVAREQGGLSPEIDVEDVVYAVTGALAGFEVRARRDPEWGAGEVITRFWRLMLPRLAGERVMDTLVPGGTRGDVCPLEEGWGVA